jgi:hypothetical protein
MKGEELGLSAGSEWNRLLKWNEIGDWKAFMEWSGMDWVSRVRF